ncbi:MAG TPA: hemolysin family protein [Thermoanaerobaculia bacterium]|nr:hemolysin family protein [Thermoanaerobaculia bacterium]
MLAASLFLLAAMIAANALYVAAEFAGVSVRRSRLRTQAEQGDRLARAALDQIEPPERLDDFVAACQVGITLSSLALGAVGQAQLAPRLAPSLAWMGAADAAAAHTIAAVLVLAGLTALQMVLGELVPKSLALYAPVSMARWTALPMRWSSRLLAWFVVALNGSGRLILRALGHSPAGHAHVHSPEELELLVTQSGTEGGLEREESRRLRRALELRRRKARHLMTPRPQVQALDADLPAGELARAVLEGAFTRYPVYRGDRENVIGILHSRDLAARLLAGRPFSPIDPILRPVVVVPETMTSDELLRVMRRKRALLLVVLDEFGGLAGIVSASDLLREVLGEVPDDFGGAPVVPEELPDGRWRLPGRLPVDRAARWTAAPWPTGADTVAGAVLGAFGRLPSPGERTEIGGLEVEVERMERHAVISVLVRKRRDGEGEGG